MARMIYTLENIHTVQDIISDLAKSLYGTRSACPRDPEAQVRFMNTYEENMQEELLAQQEELIQLGRYDGRTYKSWSEYYDYQESLLMKASMPEPIEDLPFQPVDHKMVGAIEQWAYGG